MANPTADELNSLRTRLSNFGHGNWAGKTTTTLDEQLRVAQACVDALDQFDRYESEIQRLRADIAKMAPAYRESIEWQPDDEEALRRG